MIYAQLLFLPHTYIVWSSIMNPKFRQKSGCYAFYRLTHFCEKYSNPQFKFSTPTGSYL